VENVRHQLATLRFASIGELITLVAFYAGWPVAVSAAQVAKQVVDARRTWVSDNSLLAKL